MWPLCDLRGPRKTSDLKVESPPPLENLKLHIFHKSFPYFLKQIFVILDFFLLL